MAEKVLINQKVVFYIAPIPREISADCGMCVMCSPENVASIIESLDRAGVSYSEVYTLDKKKTGLLQRLFE